jgi:hypothetical protein
MNRPVILTALAAGAAAATLALAGCGSSDDAATTAAAGTTAAASTAGTTSTPPARTVECEGTEDSCVARVSLAGGAGAERVAIQLPGTSWNIPEASVPEMYEGSYDITNAEFTTGGSVYAFTLDAVESIPDGVDLGMTFTRRTS